MLKIQSLLLHKQYVHRDHFHPYYNIHLLTIQLKDRQNILLNLHPGEDLEECSNDPLTGWLRDGCCNTDENDHGVHTVCAKVTTEFLAWCKNAGNDLITPHPEFGFPGLKDGDGWCVCASWYAKAVEAGKGCPIFLKSTHENTLKIIPIETLKKFAIDIS